MLVIYRPSSFPPFSQLDRARHSPPVDTQYNALKGVVPAPSGVVGGASGWGEFITAVGGRRSAVVFGRRGFVFLLLRAGERFVVSKAALHVVHGLRRGDAAFFCGSVQLHEAQWPLADRVEVRFRSSKGDQLRQGAMMTRARDGSSQRVEEGGR